jgi:hypothetical protein
MFFTRITPNEGVTVRMLHLQEFHRNVMLVDYTESYQKRLRLFHINFIISGVFKNTVSKLGYVNRRSM